MSKVLSGLLLATAFSAAAMDELSIARHALRDGLWNVARTHAAEVASDDARLVILESWAGEGKWDEVRRCLEGWKDVKGDAFDYYRAIVAGKHAEAAEILKRSGGADGYVEARMYEADVLVKRGESAAARDIWREIARSTNVSDRVLATASANLMDVALLRKAYDSVGSAKLRRMVGLRLGMMLLKDKGSAEDGERMIRAIVKDSPDVEGAMESFLSIADAKISGQDWKNALNAYKEAIEVWPTASKISSVQAGLGWAYENLGKREDALEAFRRAEEIALDDESRAVAIMKEGDVLSAMNRPDESMERYRVVQEKYAATSVAKRLQSVIKVRELETKGREFYLAFKFKEAMSAFAEVAKLDPSRSAMMELMQVQCLYGQGRDDEAAVRVRALVESSSSVTIRSRAAIWLAKFLYNRQEWKDSCKYFQLGVKLGAEGETAAESMMWAARAAFAGNDFENAILIATDMAERFRDSKFRLQTLLVQGEALSELGRFDEALLIYERVVIADGVTPEERTKAQMCKADALYTMGADDSSRYRAALEAYRAIRFGDVLSPSSRIVISFKIARALEKLKQMDEAIDQYYTQVVLAYRELRENKVRLSEEAKMAFSRAAFRLSDEYESRGKDVQAMSVLDLVIKSDVPAAAEAAKRKNRILNKGRIL